MANPSAPLYSRWIDPSEADFNVGSQPCENFEPDKFSLTPDLSGEFLVHDCPVCKQLGVRAICENCGYDHHKGGWGNCWERQKQEE